MNFAESRVMTAGVIGRYDAMTMLRWHGDWVSAQRLFDKGKQLRRTFSYIVGPYVDLGYVGKRRAARVTRTGGGWCWEYRWIGPAEGPIPIVAPGGEDNPANLDSVRKSGLKLGTDIVLVDSPEKVRHVEREGVTRGKAEPLPFEGLDPMAVATLPTIEEPLPARNVAFDNIDDAIEKLMAEEINAAETILGMERDLLAVRAKMSAIHADIAALTRAAEILIDRGMK